MRLRSVRARVIALVLSVAVATAAVTGWLATRAADRAVRGNAERSLEADTSILQSLGQYGLAHGSWDGVEGVVGELARSTGRRIALADGSGMLFVDSDQLEGRRPRAMPSSPAARIDPLALASGVQPALFVAVGPASPAVPLPSGQGIAGATACLDQEGVPYALEVVDGETVVVPADALDATTFEAYAGCTQIALVDVAGVGAAPLPVTPPIGLEASAVAPAALLFLGTRGDSPLLLRGPGAAETVGLLAAVVAVASLLALVLAGRLTRPLARLTAAARRLEAGELAERVPVDRSDEVGQLAHAFNSLAASLERTEVLRRRMVTDIAHELRNPLVTIGGTLEAIQDGVYPSSPEVLDALADETDHLRRLVADLHDLSLADAQGLQLARAQTDLTTLVSSVVETHQAAARAAAVALMADLPTRPLQADVDPGRIRQALANLVVNAIRHAGEGGRVDVRLRRLDDAVAIEVADDGDGIEPAHLDDVFERFWRADGSRSRDTGGSGLGLAISRSLARAHGGDLVVASVPGAGAAFTLTLPTDG